MEILLCYRKIRGAATDGADAGIDVAPALIAAATGASRTKRQHQRMGAALPTPFSVLFRQLAASPGSLSPLPHFRYFVAPNGSSRWPLPFPKFMQLSGSF